MSQRILVVEDERKIASVIQLYLENEGYEVFQASNGLEALEEARAWQPDLIVLDLLLPKLDGLEVCKILRAESNAYILMLTARSTEADKLTGLNTGADDYITKPFSPRELVARVRAVLRRNDRKVESFPQVIQLRDLTLDLKAHEATIHGRPLDLTPKEFQLLETFMKMPDRTFTREELVERVFGQTYDGFDRTVDVHIKNLRRKIEPNRLQPT
ncbi:MAG TPA: response regulator transcription factor, partial [Blastocatellia bacterium]|nr:response regulator transcription factor [Blastocatellia bacterium]